MGLGPAGRTQAAWIAAILFRTIIVPLGLTISLIYLIRIRPELVSSEGDQIDL